MALHATPTNIGNLLKHQLADFQLPLTRAHYLSLLRKYWLHTLPASLHSVALVNISRKGVLFLSARHHNQKHRITKDAQHILKTLNAPLPTHAITQLAFV